MRRSAYRRVLGAAACMTSLACASDAVGPTLEDVAGAYAATTFVGGGYDVLAAGGSLTLTLGADGSVSGNLFIPATAGGPFTADMAGTFTLSGRNLTFSQVVDTFVRDATWTWNDGALVGEWNGNGPTVAVRLERA